MAKKNSPGEMQSLPRAAALLTGVGLVSQGMGFVYRIALSRLVGAETLGLYHLIMPVYSIIQSVIMSGLAVALSSLSAGYASLGNQKAVSQLLFDALKALFLLWLPATAGVCLWSETLAGDVLGDIRTRPGLLLLLPVLLLTGVENLHKHHFYGIGETRLPAGTELAEQFIRTAAILGLLTVLLPLPQSQAVAVIVLGMLVSEVFSAVTLVCIRTKREGRFSAQRGKGERPGVIRQKLFSVAIPVSGAALLGSLISAADSILIPQKLVVYGLTETEAMEEFGVVFGMTLPLLLLPFAFVNALCLALLPRLTRCHALGQYKRLKELTGGSLRAISLLLLPMLAILIPLGDEVGCFLFQDDRVGRFLLPLGIDTALTGYECVLATTLNGIGKQSFSAGVSLFCGGIQLFFTFFGVERWGFSACIAGMLLSAVAGVLLRLYIARSALPTDRNTRSSLFAPALSAVFAGVWVEFLHQRLIHHNHSSVGAVCCCVLVGGALYLAALWAIQREEIGGRRYQGRKAFLAAKSLSRIKKRKWVCFIRRKRS